MAGIRLERRRGNFAAFSWRSLAFADFTRIGLTSAWKIEATQGFTSNYES